MKESKTVHLFTEATMRQHKMTVYNTSLKHVYCDFQTSACSYVITMARSKENGQGKHAKYKAAQLMPLQINAHLVVLKIFLLIHK